MGTHNLEQSESRHNSSMLNFDMSCTSICVFLSITFDRYVFVKNDKKICIKMRENVELRPYQIDF